METVNLGSHVASNLEAVLSPPILIYILGQAHSGSTLLDLMIGSHAEVCSVGELKALSVRRKKKRPRPWANACPCGAPQITDCTFWQAVETRLGEREGLSLKTLDLYSDDPDVFDAHNLSLLQAVRQVSGRRYVVDSSKSMDRLNMLMQRGRIDIRVIYLLRNPLGVVYSNVKRGRDWRGYAHKNTKLTMSARGLLKRVPYHTVRYEDLATAPRETLDGVMRWLGLPLQEQQFDWTSHPHHNIAGNGMRFSNDSTIRLDESWKAGLTLRQKLAIRWITLPTRLPGTWLYDRFPSLWKYQGKKRSTRHTP